MRGRLAGSALILLLASVPAVSAASSGRQGGARVTVTPGKGSPTTPFTVSFRAPDRSGHSGVFSRDYRLGVSGPAGRGCLSSLQRSPRAGRAGVLVKIRLDPARHGRTWCQGTYHGRVLEVTGPWCPPKARACPEFATTVHTLGTFTFRVRKPAKDSTPPVFAGLRRAFACTPGPQEPGQTTPYTLSWNAAVDDATASSRIVYDVYMATTSRGEDFSNPTWTSKPGATTFRTPGLAAHGGFYFVVRARDQAGNEDRNRVERPGQDPCV